MQSGDVPVHRGQPGVDGRWRRLLRRLLHQRQQLRAFIKTNDRRHIFYLPTSTSALTPIPRSV